MPVKASNLVLYPGGSLTSKEWLEVRREVLEREGHCCKTCKAPDRASILRVKGADFEHYVNLDTLEAFDSATGEALGSVPADSLPIGKSTRVILTVAHLDHNPRNNGRKGHRPNLAALCQKHHLDHDREHHAAEREKTLQAKREAEREAEFGPMLPLFG